MAENQIPDKAGTPNPPNKPTATPINEPKMAELEKLCAIQDRAGNGAMNSDVATSEAPPASSGPLPTDEQVYFDQQDKERTGQV